MKRYFYFSLLVILLVSCEYKFKENYRDIELPLEYAMMEISLNNIHPSDTIYVWARAKLTFSLNTGGLKIHDTDIRVGGNSFQSDFTDSSVSFFIEPYQIGYGHHELKVNCITYRHKKSC